MLKKTILHIVLFTTLDSPSDKLNWLPKYILNIHFTDRPQIILQIRVCKHMYRLFMLIIGFEMGIEEKEIYFQKM